MKKRSSSRRFNGKSENVRFLVNTTSFQSNLPGFKMRDNFSAAGWRDWRDFNPCRLRSSYIFAVRLGFPSQADDGND